MLLVSNYHFGNHPRLSYGWENPNHAAGALLSVISILWAFDISVEKSRKLAIGLRCAEAGFTILLALTYSRGGSLGWIIGLIYVGIVQYYSGQWRKKMAKFAQFASFQLAVFIAGTFIIGYSSRLSGSFSGDQSVTHRFEMWSGALKLIRASPVCGWGHGQSGLAYTQWVEPPMSKIITADLVNSYLDVAVEFGILALAAYIFLIILVILVGSVSLRKGSKARRVALLSASTTMVTFAVASIFNTFFVLSVIWIPLVATLLILSLAWKLDGPRATVEPAIISGWLAGLISGSCLLLSYAIDVKAVWQLHRLDAETVCFVAHKKLSQSRGSVRFLADGSVLGAYYGREIRGAMIDHETDVASYTISTQNAASSDAESGQNVVVLLGCRGALLDAKMRAKEIVVVCPTVSPPSDIRSRPVTVVLPELDENGSGGLWRALAASSNLVVHISPGIGQDARHNWREIVERYIITAVIACEK